MYISPAGYDNTLATQTGLLETKCATSTSIKTLLLQSIAANVILKKLHQVFTMYFHRDKKIDLEYIKMKNSIILKI